MVIEFTKCQKFIFVVFMMSSYNQTIKSDIVIVCVFC